MKISRKFAITALILMLVMLGTAAILVTCSKQHGESASLPHNTASAPRSETEVRGGAPVASLADRPESETKFSREPLPAAGTREKRLLWLSAPYGDGPEQLGKSHSGSNGEIRPPQSFALTAEENLLVLDSRHKRLVFYDKDRRFAKAVPFNGLAEPAEVAVAADGTIVLQDHAGVQTKGLLMLDASGTRVIAELPELQDDGAVAMYTVGKDVFFDSGLTSKKVAQTDGTQTTETSEIYHDENGVIPGHVAPDGKSVLSAGIDNFERGEFFVNLVRGKAPEHQFTRHFTAASPLGGLWYVQMDNKGDIYIVMDTESGFKLLCLNSTGDPVGLVNLPRHQLSQEETPYRTFSVVPSGGLLYRILSDKASTWEWFDCH